MAEMPRQLTQAEVDRILFNQRMGMQTTPPSIENLQQRTSGTITPIPQNLFQRMAGGAQATGDFVNRAGTAADLAKLFPGYTGQSQVNIPTGFNFAPKQDPMGGVIPGGLQTEQINLNQLLSAIKPADVLGLTGAQQAYTDVGMGRAPNVMDVLDVAALGYLPAKAAVSGARVGKGLLNAGKGLPVGMSIQDAPGLLQAAPKSDIGFYSAVEQAAMASPRKSATGQAFLNDIMKGPDVRADEIKWMGLDDYLKGKQNVTKQEVQDYIANNRVNVKEVRLGESVAEDPIGIAKRKAVFDKYEPEIQALYKQMDSLGYGTPHNVTYEIDNKLRYLQNKRDYEADAAYVVPEPIPTRHSQWQLPGGENYRELLLTMPAKQLTEAEARSILGAAPDAKLSAADIAYASRKNVDEYRSSHFSQPNILAHLRVNDRVDADGKKMLLIEEVQSDWHQAGREKGYRQQSRQASEINKDLDSVLAELRSKPGVSYAPSAEDWAKYPEITSRFDALEAELAATSKQNRDAVPDAPFKDTWYQLALKRAIQHAAENGYDRIGLTTGSQQAARFDLSKQLSGVSYNTEFKRIAGFDKSGNPVVYHADVEPDQIANYIGKEAAKKLLEQPLQNKEYALRGVDLQVGGEGMKKYYDEIYPKFLDKYGKKWGARVGETKVDAEGIQEPIRYLDVTPEMKAGVSKGQPLFQAAPIIGTGLLGSQQEER